MATLEQLENALRNADKAGDAEAAKRLAQEIIRVRQQPAQPEQAAPESRPTTRIGSALTGLGQGLTLGWGDELAAGLAATVKAPFSDQSWRDLYNEQLGVERGNLQAARQEHPIITTIGEVGGAVGTGAGLASKGATLLGRATSIPGAIGMGAAEGGAYGAVHGAGSAEEGERLEGALKGGATGAAVGGAVGGISGAIASRGRPPAPGLEELKGQANAAYRAAEQAGVVLNPQKYTNVVDDIAKTVAKEGIDPTLHPRAVAALKRLQDVDGPITFEQAETLRRVVKNAASSQMADERRIARIMTEKLDDFIANLGQGDIISGNAKDASEAIRTARSLWSRMSKGEQIESLFERAANRAGQFSGSGFENALRTEFRSLAQNPRRMRLFTTAEREAIQRVARGGPLENAMRMLGKAAPTGIVSGTLGPAAGAAVGGPVGAAAVPLAGMGGRKAAEMMTKRNALLARELMLRGGPTPPLNALILRSGTPAITGTNALIQNRE